MLQLNEYGLQTDIIHHMNTRPSHALRMLLKGSVPLRRWHPDQAHIKGENAPEKHCCRRVESILESC